MIDSLLYASTICYSSKDVLQFSYDSAIKYADVPGTVFCEMGVAAGGQVIALAKGAPNKKIYAFDSYCGLPWPSNMDNQLPGIRMLEEWEQKSMPDPGKALLESTGAVAVSVFDFLDHLKIAKINTNNIIPVQGWFEETLPIYAPLIEPISILRLDSDLYNSTYVCLQHLYPKVIKGCCVIIDDWNLPGCRAACEEYFTLIGYKPEYKFISDIAYFFK